MLVAIFIIGLVASFIGVMVGGGALISIPALILLGIPPHLAVATNKVGGVGLSISAIYNYGKAKQIDWSIARPLSLLGVLGGAIGALGLISVEADKLSAVVGIMLFLLLPLLVWKPSMGIVRRETSRGHKFVGALVYFLLMIFGGFFGGGIGPFLIATLVGCFGLTVIEANATDFFPWLLQSIMSLGILISYGLVSVPEFIAIFLGMMVGGSLGADFALRKGNKFIRTALMAMVAVMATKLLLI